MQKLKEKIKGELDFWKKALSYPDVRLELGLMVGVIFIIIYLAFR